MLTLAVVLLMLSFTLPGPTQTVRGLLVDTKIPPTSGLSFDGARIAFTVNSGPVAVYDVNSGTFTEFANPPGLALPPSISQDKVIVSGGASDITSPMTLFFCTLPHASPVHACGPWTAIATGLPGLVQQAGLGSFPVISGDVAVYVLNGGFGYYRFSSGTNTNVTTSQPHGLNTNGAIIVFSSGSPETIKYYDTSAPAGSRAIVDTGLQGRYPSITQYTIAFEDLTANPIRIRYYDVMRSQASPAGTGPIGELTYGSSAIWGDRIVFRVDETDDNFDCNGDGTISSSEYCLGYWNIRSPSWVATTLAAKAAPGVNSYPVIFDKTVAFNGSNGDLQYVTVPMKGDVNLDGVVDNTDKTTVTGCLNQLLKGTVC